jgi:hypothetical protein
MATKAVGLDGADSHDLRREKSAIACCVTNQHWSSSATRLTMHCAWAYCRDKHTDKYASLKFTSNGFTAGQGSGRADP